MRVLGYSGGIDGYPSRFGTSHDAAAALVVDGQVIAACEEERFSREKHTGAFPERAMEYCLRSGGVRDPSELTLICFYHSLSQMFRPEMLETNREHLRPVPRMALAAVLATMRRWNHLADHSDARSLRVFTKHTGRTPAPEQYRVIPPHLCHAASAFYPSPFDEALCLTLDAQGESASGMLSIGRGLQIEVVKQLYAPNSLGYLYGCLTHYLGFGRGDDFKVMELAPYGDPARFRGFFDKVLRSGEDGSFEVDPNLLSRLVVRDALCPPGRADRQHAGRCDPLFPRHRDRSPGARRHGD